MSLPSQVDKTGKHRSAAMKEAEVYYGMGPPAIDTHSDVSAGTSGVASQNLGHYQQQQVKWMHPETMQQGSGWSQDTPLAGWGQNIPSYMGGVNIRGQMFHKGVPDTLQMGGENRMQEVYRDNSQQVQWDPMHQLQAYQQQPQTHQTSLQAPILQPFQTFRAKQQQQTQQQQFNPGYYTTGFGQNKAMPNLGYASEQQGKATQQPLLHQIQQQQQQQQLHHQQHQIQQHQIQLQQQLQQQQHLRQQQQMQIQQHYHQQQMQERHMQPIQQMSQQNVQQDVSPPVMQVAAPSKPQSFASYHSPEPPCKQEEKKEENVETPKQEVGEMVKENEKVAQMEVKTDVAQREGQPRRSRRLSREGQSPTEGKENGVAQKAEGQTTGGVIQSTRRRRRASKEINLETLAQQASKRESLPPRVKEDSSSGRQSSMAPLVIPVSVPVPRLNQDLQGGWSHARPGIGDRSGVHADHKPSVIVARRRSLRNSVTESFVQDGENDSGTDDDSKPKPKRRPRPEPLIIPPPRPSTFIPPSVYSSITSYQSNLRSPIRTMDNPLVLPPYTPPPILSPVRGGSGLYFSTFLSTMAAAGNQILPPPMTPKSATVSLLRLASTVSTESTPPLTIVTDATPVSLEPRINIGQRYQAEIPDLVSPSSSFLDHHKADLVWIPIDGFKHGGQENVDNLMNMACSSVFSGGGTNQELVLHCLYECGGDLMKTLGRLMLQDIVFPKGHPLSNYHYSGSDSWTPEEKRYFNKGISAYRKDFFMVQKLVQTKTVAQCVEFYYTFKKQVKVGRNGVLTFGPPDSPVDKHSEAVVDVKSSQQPRAPPGGEAEEDHKDVSSSEQNHQARVAQSLQAHDYAATVLVLKESDHVKADSPKPPAAPRSRAEPKKPKPPAKPPPDPDAVFPCKKCGRVFYKVKSRSAHMKSHSEQEKKAAALRQKQEEEEQLLRARRAALMLATAEAKQTQNLDQDPDQDQEGPESTEGEDDDDEDWH